MKFREEDGTEEEDEEVESETDLLHSTTTVELVIDQEHCEVVSSERNGGVE